jgi:hypothetical protein
MFFTATRTLGCQTYLDSQKEACTCSFPEKVKRAAKEGAKKVADAAAQVAQAARGAAAKVEQAVVGGAASGMSADQQIATGTPAAPVAQPSTVSARDGVRAEAAATHNRDEL